MLNNYQLPGPQTGVLDNDSYSLDVTEQHDLEVEFEVLQDNLDNDLFEGFNPEHTPNVLPFDFGTVIKPEPRQKQGLSIVNICGLVSGTPQAIVIPDKCTLMKVETSGRLWLSASAQTANSAMLLSDAQQQYSIAIIGNGEAKIIPRPQGLGVMYLSATPDNSEVSISFYSGEFELVVKV